MFYQYKFWDSVRRPQYFMDMVEKSEIRGYKLRVFIVFLLAMVLFAARNSWGMGTENLTALFAGHLNDTYVVARFLSLIGTILWAILYLAFHYYGVSYVLYIFTEIPYKWIRMIQLYVIAILLAEKAIIFAVFYFVGYTTPLSFMSLAPMATYVIDIDYIIYIINQLTVATALTIVVQYIFLSKYEALENKKSLLVKIILLQLFLAILVGLYSVLPLKEWIMRGLS